MLRAVAEYMVNAKNDCLYYMAPAQETSQNAGDLFVSYT